MLHIDEFLMLADREYIYFSVINIAVKFLVIAGSSSGRVPGAAITTGRMLHEPGHQACSSGATATSTG